MASGGVAYKVSVVWDKETIVDGCIVDSFKEFRALMDGAECTPKLVECAILCMNEEYLEYARMCMDSDEIDMYTDGYVSATIAHAWRNLYLGQDFFDGKLGIILDRIIMNR